MITNGRFYSEIAGSTDKGNDKYSPELRNCIETTAELCFDNLNSESYSPIMKHRIIRIQRRHQQIREVYEIKGTRKRKRGAGAVQRKLQ